MRFLLCMLVLGLMLTGCGKEQEKATVEATSKNQAEIAKEKLQEKADALARAASAAPSPAPMNNNAGKQKKP